MYIHGVSYREPSSTQPIQSCPVPCMDACSFPHAINEQPRYPPAVVDQDKTGQDKTDRPLGHRTHKPEPYFLPGLVISCSCLPTTATSSTTVAIPHIVVGNTVHSVQTLDESIRPRHLDSRTLTPTTPPATTTLSWVLARKHAHTYASNRPTCKQASGQASNNNNNNTTSTRISGRRFATQSSGKQACWFIVSLFLLPLPSCPCPPWPISMSDPPRPPSRTAFHPPPPSSLLVSSLSCAFFLGLIISCCLACRWYCALHCVRPDGLASSRPSGRVRLSITVSSVPLPRSIRNLQRQVTTNKKHFPPTLSQENKKPKKEGRFPRPWVATVVVAVVVVVIAVVAVALSSHSLLETGPQEARQHSTAQHGAKLRPCPVPGPCPFPVCLECVGARRSSASLERLCLCSGVSALSPHATTPGHCTARSRPVISTLPAGDFAWAAHWRSPSSSVIPVHWHSRWHHPLCCPPCCWVLFHVSPGLSCPVLSCHGKRQQAHFDVVIVSL